MTVVSISAKMYGYKMLLSVKPIHQSAFLNLNFLAIKN